VTLAVTPVAELTVPYGVPEAVAAVPVPAEFDGVTVAV
jgi:hypothetical protein